MDVIRNICDMLIAVVKKLMRLGNQLEDAGNAELADACYNIANVFLGAMYYIANRWS